MRQFNIDNTLFLEICAAMAAISPFDPFWKFILNEDSDGEESQQTQRKLSSSWKSNQTENETGRVKKVRFQLTRGSYSDDEEDDYSFIDLASMDLRPRLKEQPERRRFFREKAKEKEKRDDDHNWSILKLAFADTGEAPRRSLSDNSKDPRQTSKKDASFLAMIGLSPCQSNDTDLGSGNSVSQSNVLRSNNDQREGDLNDSGFLAMIGLSPSPPKVTDEHSKTTSKQGSDRHSKTNDVKKVNPGSALMQIIGMPQSEPEANKKRSTVARSLSARTNRDILDMKSGQGNRQDKSVTPSSRNNRDQATKVGIMKSSSKAEGSSIVNNVRESSALKKDSATRGERFRFGGTKNPIFPDDGDDPSRPRPAPPGTQLKALLQRTEPKDTAKARKYQSPIFSSQNTPTNPVQGNNHQEQKPPAEPIDSKKASRARIFSSRGTHSIPCPARENQVKREKQPLKLKETVKANAKSTQPSMMTKSPPEKEDGKEKRVDQPTRPAIEKRPSRFNRMQRTKESEEPNSGKPNNSRGSQSLPIPAALAAAGVAAIGIAAAGVAATGDLFEGATDANENRVARQRSKKDRMSMLDFLDVFSSSDEEFDEEYDEESDDEAFFDNALSPDFSVASNQSCEDEASQDVSSPIKEIVLDNAIGWIAERNPELKRKSAVVNSNLKDSKRAIRSIKTSTPSSAKLATNVANSNVHDGVLANNILDQRNDADAASGDVVDRPLSEKGIGHIDCLNSAKALERQSKLVQADESLNSREPECASQTDSAIAFGTTPASKGESVEKIAFDSVLSGPQKEHTSATPDTMAANTTSRVFYTYDDESSSYMGVQYDRYGSRHEVNMIYEDPASPLKEEEAVVLVKVEVRRCSAPYTANSRLNQTHHFAQRRQPYLIRIVASDMVSGGGKVNSASLLFLEWILSE